MTYISRGIVLLAMMLSGCGGLHEMTEGPGAKSFHPKSIAILPPVTGQYESAREDTLAVLASALGKGKRFDSVVSPEQMTDVFQNQKEAFDALVVFNAKLDNTGQPDKATAATIGKALNADALLVVRVNSWEYLRKEGDNLAKIGFGLRLVDPATGSVVWKARHERTKSYMFFKPSLKDIAADLAEEMIGYLPR
jgi:PBP1b-binding outer membrane lipoprotein LpoB